MNSPEPLQAQFQPPVPSDPAVVPEGELSPQAPPRQRTPARLQACFLRQFARSGSQREAAARTGITPRAVQRWRATNRRFAQRYDEVIARRVDILEDVAVQRAVSIDRRSVFHRGQRVATAERHNDAMLMRVLARFDRLREREASKPGEAKWPGHKPGEAKGPSDLRAMTDQELLDFAGWRVPPGTKPLDALDELFQFLVEETGKRLRRSGRRVSRESPSERHENVPADGQ